MQNFSLQELSFDNIGDWPRSIKIIAIAGVCLILLLLSYVLHNKGQLTALKKLKSQEPILKHQLQLQYNAKLQLPAATLQLQKLQAKLASMEKQLPSTTELPNILDNITKLSAINDSQLLALKPLTEEAQAQAQATKITMQLTVAGTYHNIGKFISILTNTYPFLVITNFNLTPAVANKNTTKDATAPTPLLMNLTMTIYCQKSPEDKMHGAKSKK